MRVEKKEHKQVWEELESDSSELNLEGQVRLKNLKMAWSNDVQGQGENMRKKIQIVKRMLSNSDCLECCMSKRDQ